MFILVRHAVAVSKHKWSGADQERPLTHAGLRQSEDLVGILAKHRVTGLLSSPTVRCSLTLAPTSRELGLPVEPADALALHAPVAGFLNLLDLLDRPESAEVAYVALCTHGEMFGALSRVWRDTWAGDSAAPDLADTPKGGCWVIENYNTATATALYLGQAVGEPVAPRYLTSSR